jgi:NADPH2:quinone reductase
MRAVQIDQNGGPDVLRVTDVPQPQPGPGQARVKVAYATLNPMDVNARSGAMKWGVPPLPYTLGYEYSGRVDAVGEGVDTAMVGRRVAVGSQWGGFADYAVAKAETLNTIPDDIPFTLGTVYRSTALTAWHALHTLGRLREGDVVLLQSAAGPVAIMASQIAKDAGATVIGLAGGAEKGQYAKSFGADHVIDYRADADWPAKVKALSEGRGADLIIDGVQGPDTLKNLDCLAPLGQVIYLGASAGPGPAVPIGRLIAGSARVGGLVVYHGLARTKGAELKEINAKIASGAWRYPLNAPVSLDRIAETFADFEARKLMGRTIFEVGGEV